jgi:hypothetical protein
MNFSDPATFADLPFPSLLPMPSKPFGEAVGDVQYFKYMGRSKFSELEEHMRSDEFNRMEKQIHLEDPEGSSKSHLLAALAVRLIREGKRVVYIPHSNDLLENFDDTIEAGLSFAFYKDIVANGTRGSAHAFGESLKSWIQDNDKYLIIDRLDALKIEANGQPDWPETRVKEWLSSTPTSYRCIYGGVPDVGSFQDLKDVNMIVVSLDHALDNVCRIHLLEIISY